MAQDLSATLLYDKTLGSLLGALIGDAISHVVLPGIVLAFLVTGTIGSFATLAGAGAEPGPALHQVPYERMRLVLGQHADSAHARVDAVGQREIDNAVLSPEIDRRFGPPFRQLMEARAAPPGEYQGQGVAGQLTEKAGVVWSHTRAGAADPDRRKGRPTIGRLLLPEGHDCLQGAIRYLWTVPADRQASSLNLSGDIYSLRTRVVTRFAIRRNAPS